jgi:hypothetical protein
MKLGVAERMSGCDMWDEDIDGNRAVMQYFITAEESTSYHINANGVLVEDNDDNE